MANRPVHIIMPVWSDPRFAEKQAAIARGASAAGFPVRFPEYSVENPEFDADNYERQLRSSSAVLADLTGERPSCYFEIGFAEGMGRSIHIIAEAGTDIHQSAYRHRARYYSNMAELEQLVFEILASELTLSQKAAQG
ncbi:MAG: hypothetical protein ABWX67_13075 [Allosphingosinicella sp.]